MPRSELGELPEDTYYVDELVGLMVVTTSGEEIGPILQVLESPANDVYVTARGMVPAVKQFVRGGPDGRSGAGGADRRYV